MAIAGLICPDMTKRWFYSETGFCSSEIDQHELATHPIGFSNLICETVRKCPFKEVFWNESAIYFQLDGGEITRLHCSSPPSVRCGTILKTSENLYWVDPYVLPEWLVSSQMAFTDVLSSKPRSNICFPNATRGFDGKAPVFLVGHKNDRTLYYLRQCAGDRKDVFFVDINEVLPFQTDIADNAIILSRLVFDSNSELSSRRVGIWSRFLYSYPGFVINRPGFGFENFSKPHQAMVLNTFGFDAVESVSTNSSSFAMDFLGNMTGRFIYKSTSSYRSIVTELVKADLDRLSALELSPVLFQRLLSGDDIRCHVFGDQIFPCRISGDGVDYRYSSGKPKIWTDASLEPILRDVASRASRACGLILAGIDLKYSDATNAGCPIVLEMNPMPGFEGFDKRTGGGLARAILQHPERI